MAPCSWHFEHCANEVHVCGWVCACKVQHSSGPALLCAVGGPGCCVCVVIGGALMRWSISDPWR